MEEVNQAYRDLAFVWHPDRLPKDNPRLIAKAHHMLKEINYAREQLRNQPVREEVHRKSRSRSSNYYHAQAQSRPPRTDLSGRDFSGADLREKDFEGRNLSNCNLSHANLTDAFMHRVILQGANLYRANLFRANLLGANLQGADLREANLIGADFSGANLTGANLKGARVGYGDRIMVKFTGAILHGAILPDGSVHR
ncbi:MAG: pentapeptide repeat-containing protein [Pseudanabaenaceae cyanobacterium]